MSDKKNETGLLKNIIIDFHENRNNINDNPTPTTDLFIDELANPEKISMTPNKDYIKKSRPDKTPIIEELEDNESKKENDDSEDENSIIEKKEFPVENEIKREEKEEKDDIPIKKEEDETTSSDEVPDFKNPIKENIESIVTDTDLRKDKLKKNDYSENTWAKKNGMTQRDYHRNDAKKHKNSVDDLEGFESKSELKKAKFEIMIKLRELSARGIKLGANYSMNSKYEDMKLEYDLHNSLIQKRSGMTAMKKFISGGCHLIEFLNGKVDPFGADLNGWGQNVNETLSDGGMDDNISDLYEIYMKDRKRVSPELTMAFTLAMSAIQYSALKAALANVGPSLSKEALKKKLDEQRKQEQQHTDISSKLSEARKYQQEHDFKENIKKMESQIDAETADASSNSRTNNSTKK